MSKALRSWSAPSASHLLARILDEPALTEKIRELTPPVLGALIRRIGLEDAGEIVALATTNQLIGVFDEDLWRNEQPGEQESFDAARFVLWLEVLLEAGETLVADRLAELPEDLLTLALHQQLLVLDVDDLAAQMFEGDDPDEIDQLDKALTSCLYEELDGYQLVARHSDGWDAVLAAVLALDRDHGTLLRRVLDRCVQMSSEYIADNGGLYEVLTSDEMLACDVAAEREDRRAAAGYVAPTDAASFLKLARITAASPIPKRDPVTLAHFRQLQKELAPTRRPKSGTRRQPKLRELVAAAGVTDQSLPQPSASARSPSTIREPLLFQAMRVLAEEDSAAFVERQEELAYLANVLIAGATIEQRRVRPVEAIRSAGTVVGLGLESVLGQSPVDAHPKVVATTLATHTLDQLFRLGWPQLHSDAQRAGRKFAYNDLDIVSTSKKLGA